MPLALAVALLSSSVPAWPLKSYGLVEGQLLALQAGRWDDKAVDCRHQVAFRTGGPPVLVFSDGADDWCVGRAWKITGEHDDIVELESKGALARLTVTHRDSPRELPAPYADDWRYVTAQTTPRGGSSALLEQYEKNVPRGHCSQDSRPNRFAERAAEECWDAGDRACFLQLRVRLMGDQFARLASSNVGDEQRATGAADLERPGIDVDRFFRGLLVESLDDRPVQIDPWRLSRGAVEGSHGQAFVYFLGDAAADPRLDEYDRFRAAETLTWLKLRRGEALEQVKRDVGALSLTPLARRWLDQLTE